MIAITQALSSALLHFVWQGILAALLLWTALFLLKKRSANARYAASCAVLAALTASFAITTFVSYDRKSAAPAISIPATAPLAAATMPAAPASRLWLSLLEEWALPAWSFGVLIFSMRLLWGCRQVSLMRRSGEPAGAAVLAVAARLAERMPLARPVRILISSLSDGPSVVGWIKPLILLPAASVLGLTPEQLEAVLAHELAHIRRYDYLVNMLQMLVETLFFYHPAVWWISARIRHERELCCDDAAVNACGDAVCYARALTTLERLRVTTPSFALGVTDGPLMHRVQRLLGATTREYGPSRLPGVVAICLGLACIALNMNWARAQAPSPRLPQTQLAQTPVVEDRPGITVDLRGSSLMHRTAMYYPQAAESKGVQGTVIVEVTLDAGGNVTDARVLSGPEEFRKTVLQSVLTWHFAPDAAGSRHQVSIAFQRSAAGSPVVQTPANVAFGGQLYAISLELQQLDANRRLSAVHSSTEFLRNQLDATKARLEEARQRGEDAAELRLRLEEMVLKLSRAETAEFIQFEKERATEISGRVLASIEIRGLSDSAGNDLISRLPVHEGDTVTSESLAAAKQVVAQFDEHLEFGVFVQGDNKLVFRIHPAGGAEAPVLRHR